MFTTDHCYSGCRKTLFDQISKQSEHNKQNDCQNSNANQRDPVRNVIVVSLDCTLESIYLIHGNVFGVLVYISSVLWFTIVHPWSAKNVLYNSFTSRLFFKHDLQILEATELRHLWQKYKKILIA